MFRKMALSKGEIGVNAEDKNNTSTIGIGGGLCY
jgi:hypothetical protein